MAVDLKVQTVYSRGAYYSLSICLFVYFCSMDLTDIATIPSTTGATTTEEITSPPLTALPTTKQPGNKKDRSCSIKETSSL